MPTPSSTTTTRAATWPPRPLLTREADLADIAHAAAIEAFWQRSGRFGRFAGAGGLSLACAVFRQPDLAAERGAIVVVNGRTESLLKYPEVAFDLWRNGYSVYLYDHRGQGLSDREPAVASPAERERGHVGRFEDYVLDLASFLRTQLLPAGHRAHFLLAHSMGAAVAAQLLESDAPERTLFRAAVLSSPMLALAGLGPLPLSPLAGRVAEVAMTLGMATWYAWPSGHYQPIPFDDNPYTRSPVRYRRWRDTFDRHPETRLGAPTIQWIDTSCKAMQQAADAAGRIVVPVLVLVAGADRVVHPSGIETFWSNIVRAAASPHHAQVVVPEARHELLIEIDPARDRALVSALDFYAAHAG